MILSEFGSIYDPSISTHITGLVNCTAHDDNLLHPKEGLGVLGGRQSQVGQRADSDQSHRIWVILTQHPQDLLVSRDLGRNERMILGIGASLDGLDTLEVNRGVEEVLPSLTRSEVRVLYTSVSYLSWWMNTQSCKVGE
jgi:hypothetical protein